MTQKGRATTKNVAYKVVTQCICVSYHAAAAAKLLQSCLTLCNPRDGSPPGSPIPGILRAKEHWSGLPSPSLMHESEK